MPVSGAMPIPPPLSSPSSSFTSMATTTAATTATAPPLVNPTDASLSSATINAVPTVGPSDETYQTRRPRPPQSLTRNLIRYLRSATRSNGGSRTSPVAPNQQVYPSHHAPQSSSPPPFSSSSSSLSTPPLPLPPSSLSSSSLSLSQQRGHPSSVYADNHLKPIYIYPGLLRIVRDKAIALDNQCPAVLYKCTECKRERDKHNASIASMNNSTSLSGDIDGHNDESCYNRKHQQRLHDNNRPCSTSHTETASDCDSLVVLPSSASSSSSSTSTCSPAVRSSHPPTTSTSSSPFTVHDSRLRRCSHQISCAICLDEFHGKDLVRKLPCNINHVFHSKCILDWFVSHQRCPLCNKPVARISTKDPSCVVEPRNRSSVLDARRAPSDLMAESRRMRQPRGPRRASSASLSPPQSSSSLSHLEQSQTQTMSPVHIAAPPSVSSSRRNSLYPSEHQRRQHHQHRRSSSSHHPPPFPRPSARGSMHRPSSSRDEPSSVRVAAHWRYTRHNRQPDHLERHDSPEMPSSTACGDNGRPARVTIVFPPSGDRAHRKSRGPRTYSYIVHDNVRMEMNPYIPV